MEVGVSDVGLVVVVVVDLVVGGGFGGGLAVVWWRGRPERKRDEAGLVGGGREVVSPHLGLVGCGPRDMCSFRERPMTEEVGR